MRLLPGALGGAQGCQPIFQVQQITIQHRRDIGIDRGGAGAFVFSIFGQHLAGSRHKQPCLAQGGGNLGLVFGVQKRKQQANRHRLHPTRLQLRQQRRHLLRIEGLQHLPVRRHALVDFEAQFGRDERDGRIGEEIIKLGPVLAPNLQDIAETARGHKGGDGSLAFEQGVGRHGRTMDDVCCAGVFGARIGSARTGGKNLRQPIQHGLCRVVGGGEQFEGAQFAADRVIDDKIGEGAADVEADGESRVVGHQFLVCLWFTSQTMQRYRENISCHSMMRCTTCLFAHRKRSF